MFYKLFILNLFSKMINGSSSHKIKRSKFFHTIFKVFYSLDPHTILNVHLIPHGNNCQKHPTTSCLHDLFKLLIYQTSKPPILAKSHSTFTSSHMSLLKKFDPCHAGIKLSPSYILILPFTFISALI